MRVGCIVASVWLALGCGLSHAQRAGEEILYPGQDFAKLDTFEALNLQDADKLYGGKDFNGAYAAYKAFSFEFAKSRALPYVLLRMGRCLHWAGKRHAAITAYQDVVDYFPDDVRYAAAALYYIGECHGQNGDEAKQTAVWARMVKDDDYVAQPNSGTALIYLARRMAELERFEEAAEFHWRTAVAFAQSNERAAADARNAVILHYVRRVPNHEKLKEFFIATNAFADRGGRGDNPQEDVRYWRTALDVALGAVEKKEEVARYWAGKLGELFVDNDELRIKRFTLQRVYEQDKAAWAARMDKQFSRVPATLGRVVAWVPQFNWDAQLELDFVMKHGGPLIAGAKPAERMGIVEQMRSNRDKFFAKHVQPTVSALKTDEKMWLMNRLRHPCGLHEEAKAVMRSVSLAGMSDDEIRAMGMFAAEYLTENDVLAYFSRMKDPLAAVKARFDYYISRSHRNRPFQEKALAEIPALKKDPKFATPELVWTEANLLQGLGRYEEAIKAYQAANRQPDSTWAVTDCLVALKQYPQAISTVQGLESVGGGVAAQACLKVADIYRVAGDKGKETDQLRLVLRRYPKSPQSSEAHQRLESYGVKVIGGEAEADE